MERTTSLSPYMYRLNSHRPTQQSGGVKWTSVDVIGLLQCCISCTRWRTTPRILQSTQSQLLIEQAPTRNARQKKRSTSFCPAETQQRCRGTGSGHYCVVLRSCWSWKTKLSVVVCTGTGTIFTRATLCDSAGRPTSYGLVSVSVSMSVSLSQVGVLLKRMNGFIWFLACGLLSTSPTLCFKEVQVSTK